MLQDETASMLVKQAIKRTSSTRQGLMPTVFLVLKQDWDQRVLMNPDQNGGNPSPERAKSRAKVALKGIYFMCGE